MTECAGDDQRVNAEELVAIELADEERKVLRCGLDEWGGPARCTEALAVAMGFQSVADLHEDGSRLRAALIAGDPLSAGDWRRIVVATEIVFASDVFGSGIDWSTTTGFSDEETIVILRRLQRTIARELRGALHRRND